jgi:hypothetical protein
MSPRAKYTPTGRPRGRPKDAEKVIGPDELAKIADLWLTGHGESEIARRLGVAHRTICYHVENSIRPMWEVGINHRRAVEMAKIDQIERIAWEQFRQSSDPQTRKTIKRQLMDNLPDGVGPKLAIVERVISRVSNRPDATWLTVIQWCIEQRCKIMGHYAPDRHTIQWDAELRVAGLNPAELDGQMVQRLVEKVEERRKYQKLLENMNRG